jgi:hypothetical protein
MPRFRTGDRNPFQTVYRVHIPQTRLWPEYEGASCDSLEIENFEHWLESACHLRAIAALESSVVGS